jgi:hypothetical protein
MRVQEYALWPSPDHPAWGLLLCIHDGKHYTLIGDPAKVQMMVAMSPEIRAGTKVPLTPDPWVARPGWPDEWEDDRFAKEVLDEHTWTEWEALYKKVNEAISEAMTEIVFAGEAMGPEEIIKRVPQALRWGVRERLEFLFEDENGSGADT